MSTALVPVCYILVEEYRWFFPLIELTVPTPVTVCCNINWVIYLLLVSIISRNFDGKISPIPVTSSSIFPVYALVWNLLTTIASPYDPVWLGGLLHLTASKGLCLSSSQINIHIHLHLLPQCLSLSRPIWTVLLYPISSKPIPRTSSSKQLQRIQDTEKIPPMNHLGAPCNTVHPSAAN